MALFLSLFSLSISAHLLASPENFESFERIQPQITQVFIPVGFDNNDTAQVIVEVEFNDTCDEFAGASVTAHEEFPNTLLVYVEGRKRYRDDEGNQLFCTQVKSKKIKAIDIGRLPIGTYHINSYRNLTKTFGDLVVREARTAKIDDGRYAAVDSLMVQEDEVGARRILTLAGTFSNTCLRIENIIIAKTRDNLIEVLPFVALDEQGQNGDECKEIDRPFTVHQRIPDETAGSKIETGRYLFHVRTMNGGSHNKIDYVVTDPNDLLIP